MVLSPSNDLDPAGGEAAPERTPTIFPVGDRALCLPPKSRGGVGSTLFLPYNERG